MRTPAAGRFALPAAVALTALAAAALAMTAWVPNGTPVKASPTFEGGPALVARFGGGAFVAWVDERNAIGNDEIYVRSVDSTGALLWAADVGMAVQPGDQSSVRGVPDGAGGALFLWTDYRSGSSDLYGQRLDAAGTAQWAAGGVLVCGEAGNQTSPVLLPDGLVSTTTNPGAYVTWEDRRTATAQVFVQHVPTGGGVSWSAGGIDVSNSGFAQTQPQLVGAGDGSVDVRQGIVAVYQQAGIGSQQEVYAQRIDRFGALQWGAGGVSVCSATGNQVVPQIVRTGDGYVIAWSDQRAFPWLIHAQKLNGSGAPQWTLDGRVAAPSPGSQTSPAAVAGPNGSTIVSWEDGRHGVNNMDIYMQRLGPNGERMWGDSGIVVCKAPGPQMDPVLLTKSNGRTLVVWNDGRTSGNGYDLYAQLVDSSGACLLDVDGVAVSTGPGSQAGPVMITDGGVGAILAWGDTRDGESDLYATRIVPMPPLDAGERPALDLRLGATNPVRTELRWALELPRAAAVTIDVLDVGGRRIARLERAWLEAGRHERRWRPVADDGAALAPGAYLLRVRAGTAGATRKFVLVR